MWNLISFKYNQQQKFKIKSNFNQVTKHLLSYSDPSKSFSIEFSTAYFSSGKSSQTNLKKV